MKKWTVMLVAIVLILSLMGCASNGTGGSGQKVLVASDATYSPMEYMDKDKMTGFDIEFLAEVMKEAGINYEARERKTRNRI
jgi:polar amino acid transport system substrate-binding protein